MGKLAGYKHFSLSWKWLNNFLKMCLFGLNVGDEEKMFYNVDHRDDSYRLSGILEAVREDTSARKARSAGRGCKGHRVLGLRGRILHLRTNLGHRWRPQRHLPLWKSLNGIFVAFLVAVLYQIVAFCYILVKILVAFLLFVAICRIFVAFLAFLYHFMVFLLKIVAFLSYFVAFCQHLCRHCLSTK